MNSFYIGLATTLAVIILFELLKKSDKHLLAAFTLVGIAFIYVGFSWKDIPSLIYTVLACGCFIALAYFGYQRNFMLIIWGLVGHGIWDILFPFISSAAPHGYDIFCITIDILLALYFFVRIQRLKPAIK